jgi:hypothetical protein
LKSFDVGWPVKGGDLASPIHLQELSGKMFDAEIDDLCPGAFFLIYP